jgi:chromosome segregation ATPase
MNHRLLQFTAVACAGSLFFTGCANIKDDTTRTKTEGTLAGAGLGALVGAGIGALAGGAHGRGIAAGAAIGAAAGGAGGYAYGSHVARKKQGYAASEERLSAMIDNARSERQSAEAYNSNLRRAIAQQRTELDRLSAARRSGQSIDGDANRLRRNLDGNIERTNEQIQHNNEVLGQVRETLNGTPDGADKAKLQAEYNSLSKEKALLSQNIREMNGMKQDLASASR